MAGDFTVPLHLYDREKESPFPSFQSVDMYHSDAELLELVEDVFFRNDCFGEFISLQAVAVEKFYSLAFKKADHSTIVADFLLL